MRVRSQWPPCPLNYNGLIIVRRPLPREKTLKLPKIFTTFSVLLLAAASLVGCANAPSTAQALTTTFSPYQPDILQGNVITREQVAALKAGMDRTQVEQILGTPLLRSVFHAQRWDYYFSFQRQGAPIQHRRLTLYFEGPQLTRFEGDEMPSETEFVNAIARPSKTVDPATLTASPEALDAFKKKNPPPAADAPQAPQPKTSYPPLQSGSGLLQ